MNKIGDLPETLPETEELKEKFNLFQNLYDHNGNYAGEMPITFDMVCIIYETLLEAMEEGLIW